MLCCRLSSLDEQGKDYWSLDCDPFFKRPLKLSRNVDWSIFVRSSPGARLAGSLAKSFREDTHSKIIIMEGDKGWGKSTAIEYLGQLVKQDPSVFAAYCDAYGILPFSSSEELAARLHPKLLRTILDSCRFDRRLSTSLVLEGEDTIKRAKREHKIEEYLELVLRQISYSYERILICVDNLDKVPFMLWSRLAEYFGEQQPFYETITDKCLDLKSICYTVFPMMSQAEKIITRDASYFGDNTLRLKMWAPKEIRELVQKRLYFAHKGHDFDINNFFTEESLKLIYERNDGNPRYCQEVCSKLLQQGSIDRIKLVSADFCNKYPDLTRSSSAFVVSDLELLSKIIRHDHAAIYMKLRSMLKEGRHDPGVVLGNLLVVYCRQRGIRSAEVNDLETVDEVLDILSKYELLNRRTMHGEIIYTLSLGLREMIDTLYEKLHEDMGLVRLLLQNIAL